MKRARTLLAGILLAGLVTACATCPPPKPCPGAPAKPPALELKRLGEEKAFYARLEREIEGELARTPSGSARQAALFYRQMHAQRMKEIYERLDQIASQHQGRMKQNELQLLLGELQQRYLTNAMIELQLAAPPPAAAKTPAPKSTEKPASLAAPELVAPSIKTEPATAAAVSTPDLLNDDRIAGQLRQAGRLYHLEGRYAEAHAALQELQEKLKDDGRYTAKLAQMTRDLERLEKLGAAEQERIQREAAQKITAEIRELLAAGRVMEALVVARGARQGPAAADAGKLAVQAADILVRQGRDQAAALVTASRKLPKEARQAKLIEARALLDALYQAYPEATLRERLAANRDALSRELGGL